MSFAFKIDKALKANLYKICRLCGIDRDEKVGILDAETTDDQEPVDCDGELTLDQKIIQCIGITVTKDDKMPQSACILCVDKINDFYEFREMCYATDIQTRKLLGLKRESQKKNIIADVKPIIDIKEEAIVKRGRKRKSDEVIGKEVVAEVKTESASIPIATKKQRLIEPPTETKKKGKFGKQIEKTVKQSDKTVKQLDKNVKPKEEIKEEPVETEKPSTTTTSVPKFRQVCNICDQRFGSKVKLEQHVAATHVPNIPRYVCTACNETIKKTNDIKSHQLWHKLSKTPYICGHCGQSLISSYAYSRHLRDHTVEIPPNLWVLDRECPQCHQTFLTNFLYNTHPCAVRTKKCAGCNRQLRNEVEYQRHAAHCTKVCLNYSKHIPVAAAAAESTIRIKNENDVEAAAAEALARNSGISLDMTPIVSLTRISTPEIIAASQGNSVTEYNNESATQITDDPKTPGKKGNKKGVSRKDLKRVDNLLKSTLDALVSIKHEPEVHVETDTEAHATADESANKDKEPEVPDDDNFQHDDDFHHGDDDNDEEESNGAEGTAASTQINDVPIKQEPMEENVPTAAVNIKQEVINVDNDSTAPAAKMPVLKLKIKKEHGTLNSSIVEEQSVRVEKKKKKKKRKDADKKSEKPLDGNEQTQQNPAVQEVTEATEENPPNSNVLRPIKQERLDGINEETEGNRADSSETVQTGATVMTTIPIPQFQISAISSGVEFGDNTTTTAIDEEADAEASEAAAITTTEITTDEVEMEDIKPNKAELDRLFQITSVSSGVQMEQEIECNVLVTNAGTSPTANITPGEYIENPTASVVEKEVVHRKTSKTTPKVAKHKAPEQKPRSSTQVRAAKAFKSTAGVSKSNTNKIGGVGDITDYTQVLIKPEPVDRGYEDVFNAYEGVSKPTETQTTQPNEGLSVRELAEQEYLNNIDFTNIQIKQEKDLDVSDVEMTNTHIVANAIPNGMKRSNGEESQYSENEEDTESLDNDETDDDDDDDDDDDNDDEDDDDWVGIKKEEKEKREYRELEMPPLLLTEEGETIEKENVDEDKLSADLNSVNFVCASGAAVNYIATNEQTTNAIQVADIPKSTEVEPPPPFMITGIYSQANCDVSNQFPAIIGAATPFVETDTEMQPSVEANTLKIASVIAGCSRSFDNFSKDVEQQHINTNLFAENLPIALDGEAMEVADAAASIGVDLLPRTADENMPDEVMNDLLPVVRIAHENVPEEVVGELIPSTADESMPEEARSNLVPTTSHGSVTEEAIGDLVPSTADENMTEEAMHDLIPTTEHGNVPAEAMGVLIPSGAHWNMPAEKLNVLPPSTAFENMPEEAMDITPAAETIRIEVTQDKDALLDAQPFSDSRAESVNTVDTSQITFNSNVNIPLDIPIQSNAQNVIEETQNVLNHEVVEAQAIQRLTLDASEATQNVEETENLMNESVAEAQLQQQHTYTQPGRSGGFIQLTDPESEKSCSNASNSDGSIGCSGNSSGGGGSGSGVVSTSDIIGRSSSQSTLLNHPFMLDDSNINEIAENNNNANIERELQDDVAAATTATNTVTTANVTNNTAEEPSNAEVMEIKMNDIT